MSIVNNLKLKADQADQTEKLNRTGKLNTCNPHA